MRGTKSIEKKLVLGITFPGSIILLKGQALYFKGLGYKVFLLSPPEGRIDKYCAEEGCTHIPVNIARTINPLNDIIILFKLINILKRIKPDVVNVGTPKMGLLGTVAAAIVGVKNRIYTCRGLRYEHENGLTRRVLMTAERVAAFFAHKVVCIAPSLYERAVTDKVFPREKARVIGKGSSNGLDLSTFDASNISNTKSKKLKNDLGVGNKFVFGFVGRILDRKGVQELYDAFLEVYKKNNNVALILVGSLTKGQISNTQLIALFDEHPAILWVGWQDDIPLYMSIFDVFIVPSWWEGFGNAFIQAAAMGLPVITTNGTGCRDAVKNGYNGILVPVKDVPELVNAMKLYLENEELRREHGNNGLKWAQNFRPEMIWDGLNNIYNDFYW